MSRVRILGIGSPSGDDQAGWLTVDALAACGVHAGRELDIEKLDRPGTTLISRMENADWVILVDATQSSGRPGSIHRFDRNAWPDYQHGLSSHGFGVLAALTLARELGNLPPRLDLYGIEVGSVLPGEEAGHDVQEAAQRLAAMIVSSLENEVD